jgi:predicted TPR repeat methyltransferase
MGVFEAYASYYDLLYMDKDYESECLYVQGLIRELKEEARNILDLGCGTGRHAEVFSQMGYAVHGVDISNEMLEFAASRVRRQNVSFSAGDTRTVRLGRRFDVVLSLFHVMSYQVTNDDLRRSFLTAGEHLGDRGPFIFDIWYGPAVLTQRPSVRGETI